ncbi:MAG: MtrAB system histidine kinase MtrB [Propionibacteriaceae bacterium]|nr:MtrAB system histidine kinase MtrB [Propionibacteriaceae bacterium]
MANEQTAPTSGFGFLRRWSRSLPFRVVAATMAASLVILSATGLYLLDQSSQGILERKTQASLAQATSVLTNLRSQLAAIDPRSTSLSEQVARLVQDVERRGKVGDQYHLLLETPVVQIVSPGLSPTTIPDTIRSALDLSDGLWSTPTLINYTDGRPNEPGLVVAAQLRVLEQLQYPIFFVFPTTAELQALQVVQQATWAAGLFLLIGLSVTVYLIALMVLRPIRAARVAAERLAAGHLEDRMRVVGDTDISSLAASMNHMASELDKKITQLQNLSTLQQRFVSDVSHELRTPMTTIRMAAEVIDSHRDEFDAPIARSSELLSSQLDRFEDLLAELLEISRFDAGAAVLHLEEIDLSQLVQDEVDAVRPLAEETGSEITVNASGLAIAEIDERRVRRIVRNLLTNAIEHGEGEPIEVQVGYDSEAVALTVRDHGVGLSAGDARKVFDRFWRADPARARRLGGTGLGLAIASEDARLHGGTLDLWGYPDKGTQFRLTLARNAGTELTQWPLARIPEGEQDAE